MKVSDRSEIHNAFEFVTVASARARQLQAGCIPQATGSAKVAHLAQTEVTEGRVRRLEPEADTE